MKKFNPSSLNATIEEINALTEQELRDLHKMYPTRKPYLKISYSSKNDASSGYATYGSLVGLRPLKKNVAVVGIVGAEISEVKVSSEVLAPVRSLKVEHTETVEEPMNETENDLDTKFVEAISVESETENEEALTFAKAKYFEIVGKEVPKNKAKNLEWILSKIS